MPGCMLWLVKWRCLLAFVLLGCDSSGLIAVDLVTDFTPGVEFDSVEVMAEPMLGSRVRALDPSDVSVAARRVAEFGGARPDTYAVRVELRARGRAVAHQSLLVRLENNAVVTAVIPRSCEGIECGPSATCVRGECAVIECASGDEPTCPPPECTVDGDCAPTSACASARCVEGSCLASVGSGCPTGLLCSARSGCVAAGASDAGVVSDAGPSDAGPPDAGARAACCTAWCRDDWRFGGASVASEAYVASNGECSSSTGCTCAVSASIASTWTLVTGDVCDAHDFATECPEACDGSQCTEIQIEGRYDPGSETCTCVGTDPAERSQDVWSSECAENTDTVPFAEACPAG